MFPRTIAIPAPWLASARIFSASLLLRCSRLLVATLAHCEGLVPPELRFSDRPIVAEPPHRGCQLMVFRDELIKIFLADFQQVRLGGRLNGGSTRLPAEEGHLAECLSFAQLRELFSGDVSIEAVAGREPKHVDLALRHDVERVSSVAGTEENLAIVEVAVADAWQDSFDFFRRQMAQQIAFRQQLDRLFRILLLAPQGILAKSCRVAYRRTLPVKEQGRDIINDGTEREAAANERPGRIGAKTLPMQFLGAFERQFDRQRTD